MKKLIFLFIFLILLTSCNNDLTNIEVNGKIRIVEIARVSINGYVASIITVDGHEYFTYRGAMTHVEDCSNEKHKE
jgi:hypothetical protein